MEFWRRFKRHQLAVVGALIVVALLIVALFAPLIAPKDPNFMDLGSTLATPSFTHPFGTDHLGRDILSRIIYGTRISFIVGVAAVSFSAFAGGVCGLFAGYFGRKTDMFIMRTLDVIWAFPPALLTLAIVAIRGASLSAVVISIGIVGIPSYARLVRGTVLSIKAKDYILAAKATGISNIRIIFTHILPNVLAPVIVIASLGIALAITVESILSYLGLGMQPPASSWGLMISEGQKYLRTFPYYSLFPGLMIMITVFSFNIFGDGLRDAWDPKLKT
jgi:ABC-type dipeptide/oligopeptide/nickel transport system permease subunit